MDQTQSGEAVGEALTRDGRAQAAARPAGRRAAIVTLAVGAVLLAAGLIATLSHAGVRRSGTNDVVLTGTADTLRPGHTLCQTERIPARTAAIETSAVLSGPAAATVLVQVLDPATGARLASGTVGEGAGPPRTAPLRPAIQRERAALVCMQLRAAKRGASAEVYGSPTDPAEESATDGSRSLGARVRFDYLRAGRESWWSFAPTVAERLGRGRAWFGAAAAPLAALLVLIAISASAWLLVRTD